MDEIVKYVLMGLANVPVLALFSYFATKWINKREQIDEKHIEAINHILQRLLVVETDQKNMKENFGDLKRSFAK